MKAGRTVSVPVISRPPLLSRAPETVVAVRGGQPFSFQLEPQSPLMEEAVMGAEGTLHISVSPSTRRLTGLRRSHTEHRV